MFVVLGASGNTGKVVAETLLQQEKKVRIVLHVCLQEGQWLLCRVGNHAQTKADRPARASRTMRRRRLGVEAT
jgi:hypothetical protein